MSAPEPRSPAGHPRIIQGGMGIAISSWRLARAVSAAGQLGVVSGVALDTVLARRLQSGDEGGHCRRALARLPLPGAAERILARYFREGGLAPDEPYRLPPPPAQTLTRDHQELLVAGNFVEVSLAREGHDGPVGINYLEKLQMFTLPSLYGALLAGATHVLMGAGIPREIPRALDRLAAGEPAALSLAVHGAAADAGWQTRFAPADLGFAGSLRRPMFLAIVSSTVLSKLLARLGPGAVNGLVVESHAAGGHNAPPRDAGALTALGEPVYGDKDRADLAAVKALGLPFWLAGSSGTREGLRAAIEAGAEGIQAGSAFALCRESGLAPGLKAPLLRRAVEGALEIRTDPRASPTGFPFKVAAIPGTLSDPAVYAARRRRCDAGGLRQPYLAAGGELGYRCPAEPVAAFVAKGGDPAETEGRKCLCNALLADAGLGQRIPGGVEPPLVTLGRDAAGAGRFLAPGAESYGARDVIERLLAPG